MSCLVGCIPDYKCNELITPIEGESLAPYVKLFFGDPNNPTITVGNESAPNFGNTAVVKSFEYGTSTGVGVTTEIMDQEGGMFHQFAEKLQKCLANNLFKDKNAAITAEWGWIVGNCDGTCSMISSPQVTLNPDKMSVAYAEGKLKFTITASDPVNSSLVTRHNVIEGKSNERMYLKNAIEKLAEADPDRFPVRLVQRSKDGSPEALKFKEGGENGPSQVWTASGQNKFKIIEKWLQPFVTENGKGVIMLWDTQSNMLWIMEDPTPGCNESADSCENVIGTFVVNGGECSSVISFTNTIDWISAAAALVTGDTGGGANSGAVEERKKECQIQAKEVGLTQTVPLPPYLWEQTGNKNAAKVMMNSLEQQAKAKSSTKSAGGTFNAIEGELRIQGNNRKEFIHATEFATKFISLVIINPFNLLGYGCGDWLARPLCQEILSSKKWQINGTNHSIREGSYVTTLSVRLAVPGIDLDKDAPLGGFGSGGYTPINTC